LYKLRDFEICIFIKRKNDILLRETLFSLQKGKKELTLNSGPVALSMAEVTLQESMGLILKILT
jgi:hypothetical protein